MEIEKRLGCFVEWRKYRDWLVGGLNDVEQELREIYSNAKASREHLVRTDQSQKTGVDLCSLI